MKGWIDGAGAKTAFIEPGGPWENDCVESFNGKLRDELLNAEVFNTLAEAKVPIEQWRVHYNTMRPHPSLRYRPPAPDVADLDPVFAELIKISNDNPAILHRPDDYARVFFPVAQQLVSQGEEATAKGKAAYEKGGALDPPTTCARRWCQPISLRCHALPERMAASGLGAQSMVWREWAPGIQKV